jgi:hypothetical protein
MDPWLTSWWEGGPYEWWAWLIEDEPALVWVLALVGAGEWGAVMSLLAKV